jgi:hypothetical protein
MIQRTANSGQLYVVRRDFGLWSLAFGLWSLALVLRYWFLDDRVLRYRLLTTAYCLPPPDY